MSKPVLRRNMERMAKRTYRIDDVLRVACELANITPLQVRNTPEKNTPKWAPMARAAVIGAIYELCEISLPELTVKFGHAHPSGSRSQILRFHDEWPRLLRRSWLETVLVRLDAEPSPPEITHP